MRDGLCIQFDHRPAMLTPYIKGLLTKRKGLKEGEKLPQTQTVWNNFSFNTNHHKQFNTICGLENSKDLSIVYPLTVVFPLHMHILSHKAFPLSPFTMLQNRIKVKQFKPLNRKEQLDIDCTIESRRNTDKGMEIDIISNFVAKGETVWQSVNTYFFRGKFGAQTSTINRNSLTPILTVSESHTWKIPAKGGFRFARLTGDYNGIHYNTPYARLLGFKSCFSHKRIPSPASRCMRSN